MTTKQLLAALLFLLLLPRPGAAQCPLLLDSLQWEEVLRDDFTGAALDTALWDTNPRVQGQPYYGWGCEWYDSRDTSLTRVSNGVLQLRATRWRNANGQLKDSVDNIIGPGKAARQLIYRAGMINLKHKRLLESYGVYEARLKLPIREGAWPTFWLWSCPTEIDIVDGVGYWGEGEGLLCNVIDNRMPTADHGGNTCNPPLEANPAPKVARDHSKRIKRIPVGRHRHTHVKALTEQFNTFTLVWTPNDARFYINGRPTFGATRDEVGTVQDFVTLMVNMQMYPWGGDEDAVLEVDYVRILKPRAPAGGGSRPYASTLAVDPACVAQPPSWLARVWEQIW